MKTLQKQNINKQDFSVFLRDLSQTLNINLKHMIEDCVTIKNENEKKKKNYHKGKKVVKKKDLIIEQQKKKKEKENYDDDLKKIEFMFQKLDNKNPFDKIDNLKTEKGRNEYHIKLLEYFWNQEKKQMHYIFSLYFSLKNLGITNDIITNVSKILEEYDYKLFMMKKMGNMLPPLDVWNQTERKFEDWQIETIKCVHKGESVIVKAPTSSGKSFIAMSAGIFHKKILYVCPAKPVVYQVGAHFSYMGYKVHFLVDNHSNYSYDSKTNIFIGTPLEIENNLLMIKNNFDYVVFDEIHNLNKKEDGDIYENILKLVDCNFLALSATVKNVDFLKTYFKKINPNKKINYIEYNKRFINQQRWLWNGENYSKIHPFCAYKNVNEIKIENNLSFTPSDCALLWEKMEDIFEDILDSEDILSPDEYFTDERMLSLDDCREYESFLKEKCINLADKYPEKVQELFDGFQDKNHKGENIIDFIKKSKENDMFPMLMFHTDEYECKSIFNDIYESLDKEELREYPYHYDILEKKQELYEEYISERETYKSSIKISNSITNPEYFIKDKMQEFDRREKIKFTTSISEYYQSKINDVKKNDIENKNIVLKNLKTEMNDFLLNPDFCYQDVFQKHKDFIFTKTNKPMDADTIRSVRREIKKTLGIKIEYTSPLFQMLKRGIGLYIDNMPDEYNWILQKLLSNKEIGIVISDKTLCLGIDLPVRTSCFLGLNNAKFTRDEYLQMAGRAGRRGKDTQGNIVFYGDIDYLELMKGELPEIVGNTNNITNMYDVINKKEIYENIINSERTFIKNSEKLNVKNDKLLWSLRRFPELIDFLNDFKKLEKTLYQVAEYDREKYILDKLSIVTNIKDIYKNKKIQNYSEVNECKKILDILMYIHNNINYQQYMVVMNTMKDIFDNINRMIFNYII